MTKARDLANASTALSAVSATELAFLDGVTSAVQTQVDAKIAKTLTTTTGDIIYASGANTPARLGIGSTAQVLTVASGVPSWATPAVSASGLTLIKTQTIGTTVSSVSVTDIFSATYDNYLLTVSGGVSSTGTNITLRLGTTSTGYYVAGMYIEYGSSTITGESVTNHSGFYAAAVGEANSLNGEVQIFGPNLAKNTHVLHRSSAASTAGPYKNYGGYLANTTQYTSVTIFPNSGTLTGGTIKVYGYQNS